MTALTEEYVVFPTREKEKERRPKGFGAWFSRCAGKLGLGPSVPASTGRAIFTGARVAMGGALNGGGFLGGMLATNYGIAALGIASVTAIMMGTACVGWLTSIARPAANFDHLGQWGVFAMPPKPAAPPADALAQASEASASLDYINQAIKNDPWLQGRINEAAGAKPPAAKAAESGADAPSYAAAPVTRPPSAAAQSAAHTTITKMQGFGNAPQVALGGAGSSTRGGDLPYRDALNSPQKVMGLTPFGRHMSAVTGGRQAGFLVHGPRTADALRAAVRDGLAQKASRAPSMQGAGLTFDGAGAGIQGAPSAPVSFGGIPNDNGRVSPNSVMDQKDIPGPPPPATGDTKNTAPYQWAMYAAIGALLIAMLLSKMAGSKKDAAKAMPPGPAQVAAYMAAANMYWLAAAAAAAAAALGGLIIGMYQQMMQGLIFVGSGGMLAFFNAQSALDVTKTAKDSEEANKKAVDGINDKGGQIKQDLGGQGSNANNTNANANNSSSGSSDNSGGMPLSGLPGMNGTPSPTADAAKNAATTPRNVTKVDPPAGNTGSILPAQTGDTGVAGGYPATLD